MSDERGRVTLTLRNRDGVRLSSPSGEDIEVSVDRAKGGRVSVSIVAPKSYDISRVPRTPDRSSTPVASGDDSPG